MPNFRLVALLFMFSAAVSAAVADDWPFWRGPTRDGVASPTSTAPLHCSQDDLAWSIPVPGEGHSSPVVSGGYVFLTTAEPTTGERLLLAYDRHSGAEAWRAVVAVAAREDMHRKNTPASATPATDGRVVVTSFDAGGRFLLNATSVEGEPIWRRELGSFISRHGFCQCPVIHERSVMIAGLQDSDESFVARLDMATGETLWRTPTGTSIRSFSPPHVVDAGKDRLVVVSGAGFTMAFDWSTGAPCWQIGGPAEKTVSSLLSDGDRLIVCGGRDAQLLAIDVTRERADVAWNASTGIPYVPSPLLFDDAVHLISDRGVYTKLSLDTGDRRARRRLLGTTSASPVRVGTSMLVIDESGQGVVVDLANDANAVAEPRFNEAVFASPAVTDNELFVRTVSHLYCFRGE